MISRRKFLVTGIGAVAAIGGVAYYARDKWLPYVMPGRSPTPTITTPGPTSGNNPPYADFELVKPKYILPAVGQEVLLRSTSKDEDGDPLIQKLYVNEVLEQETQTTNQPIDFRFKFKQPGTNRVKLEVSDGKLTDAREYYYEVEPDQIYPTKPFNLKYKGIGYFAGNLPGWPSSPTPSRDRMERELEIIRDDLGCNAVRIVAGGSYEDNLIECGKLAVDLGFDRIFICPRYMDETMEKTIERIGAFGGRVRDLKEISESIVYMVGNEFPLDTFDMIGGGGYYARVANMNKDWGRVVKMLPAMMREIIRVCREKYGYPISYAAIVKEVDLIPWSDPAFESVGVNAYLMEYYGWDNWRVRKLFGGLKLYRKPIHSTEWGCMSYTDAGRYGAMAALHFSSGRGYDEDEQANYIDRYCRMLNQTGIDGSFYIDYFETGAGSDTSYTLLNGVRRKKGFYMYKSFQRLGS